MNLRQTNKRIAVSVIFVLVLLLALFGRAFYVQVLAAPGLKAMAKSQSVDKHTLVAHRGNILDRNGAVLACSEPMPTVSADPRLVKDPSQIAAELAPLLGVGQEELKTKLTGTGGFAYLARKVDPSIGQKVKALKLAGVNVSSEDLRVYPAKALAPQLLGFVDTENLGVAGLEKQYDTLLSGTAGNEQVVHDSLGHPLEVLSEKAPVNGASLTLTVDSQIQYEAEDVLGQLVKQVSAKKASAVVLDPKTGEILAMANTPVFDTNDFARTALADQRNSAVSDQYEPGSTFKVVVTAAALAAGLVTPATTFRLAPSIKVYDRVIHEAEVVPAVRNLSVTQILAQSSNVGAVTLGLEVGKDRLVDMIRRFGFAQPLGIDFPGEAAGSMLPPDKWSGTTIANVPIGQGIAVTPLQMVSAYAAIANNGVLVQPHIAKDDKAPATRQVISPQIAAELRSMLTVTVQSGTGTKAQIPGYDVAGKTGTAQEVDPNVSGYAQGNYASSFVGMVPANDPQLVILVVVDDPSTEHMGAEVAAPAFATIAKFSLERLGIAPKGQA